jgi:hypothetical protein
MSYQRIWATAMDTDKIKIFGARVKVDGTGKLAELERAERVRVHSLPLLTESYMTSGKNESKSRRNCVTWN